MTTEIFKLGKTQTPQEQKREITQIEQRVLTLWQEVPEKSKGELVARLLDKTEMWHQYAVTEAIALSWLKAKFETAGIPFINRS